MKADLERVKVLAEIWKPEQVLAWAFAAYGDSVAIATGFGVEGCVVDLAQGQSVWHHGVAVWVTVGQDVRGVELGWVA